MTATAPRTARGDDLALLLGLAPSADIALTWRGAALTYAALVSAVDELTDRLAAADARGRHLLLLGPLCPAYVVGLLASLRCGAVPVPVDTGLTPGGYAWAEQAAKPALVVSSDVSTVEQYQGAGYPDSVHPDSVHPGGSVRPGELVLDAATGRVVLDTATPTAYDGGAGARAGGRHRDADAGYLLPTSGSTGAPKAVVGSRSGLHAFLSWFVREFALGPDDVCAAATRVNFDPSLRELLAVLAAGGRLSLPDVDVQLDLPALARHLADSRPTLLFLVPSLARRVADVLEAGSHRLDRLRLGFFAGEVLPARVAGQWARLAPGAELVNLYGLTEGTLAQLFRRGVRAGDAGPGHGLPVGRPRPGVTVTIDRPDAEGRGEVLITSSAPALGTLRLGTLASGAAAPGSRTPDTRTPDSPAPDTRTPHTRTPDSTPPDSTPPHTRTPDSPAPDSTPPDTRTPDSTPPDTRTPDTRTPDSPAPDSTAPDGPRRDGPDVDPMPAVLRTGDLGFLDAAGDLHIAGRLGDDLKVAGRRVSYHRFVDAVEDLPGVRQCAVVDHQGPHAFVAADLAPEAYGTLREQVSQAAARVGVPRPRVHVRAELPLLRSGKVDRQSLTAALAGPAQPPSPDGPAPAPADTRRSLLRIVEAAAGPLGADTSFVDAGLTSLDMMELVLAVDRSFGVRLSVRDCYELRDVASLARAVEQAARDRQGAAPVPAVPAGDVPGPAAADAPGTVPLSTRQLAYMAVCMADGNADWCNLSREVAVGREVGPAEVRAALDALVARHDALRLALTADWRRLVHTDAASLRCEVTVHHAPAGGAPGRDPHRALVQQARVEAVSRLIDPRSAPAIRAVLVPGAGAASVVLVGHHLFVDGLSMDLLAGELATALMGGRLPEAPAPQRYRDYCRATERTAGPSPDAGYWRALLAGAGQVALPQAPGPEAREGMLLSLPFGVGATRTAHRLAAAAGVSVFTVLLAAYDRAVAAVFGVDPLTIVVPVQVRGETNAATAGMFMSQLAVRGGEHTRLVERAREFARQLEAGVAHSGWEFDQRAEDLGLARSGDFPLSTVLFNQHPRPRGRRAHDLGQWSPRPLGRSLRYQLQGEVQVSGAEMALTYYYRRGIRVAGTDVVERVHDRVLRALREAEEDRT
ncbi:AMP-binding protein [Streptomyces sp. HPF1205]|uniref:AMP-binding protein n=1 Tax=Streptomyces sp. HPF1205 TaxID=2873262 RepID=UPI0027E1259F|nr:AMP-binding protein [Streptomyces sp. HPF1205]